MLVVFSDSHHGTSFATSSPTKTGIMVSLYGYPGSTWDSVIQAKAANPSVPFVAIINPSNGPGSAKDSNFVSGIQKLQAANITVIGYIYTSYASRLQSQVQSDINTYASWYKVNGTFFDAMPNIAGYEQYYSSLSSYAKSLGQKVTVGNPGTDTLSSYVGTVDNLVIYENAGLPSINYLAGGWHANYDKKNFTFLSYGVSSLDTSFVTEAANYTGFMYITNDNLPNPWDTVPPYLNTLASTLASTIPDSTPPTISIISPASSSYLNTVTVGAKGTSSDNVAVANVQVSVDSGAYVLASGTTSWSYTTPTLSQGTHTLYAKSTDTSGLVSTIASDSFSVDTIAPIAPTITSPLTGTTLTTSTPTISGTAEASSTVTVYDGTTLKATTTATSTGTWSVSISLTSGSHSIIAKATDKAGNISPSSAAITITISSADTIPPSISITSPSTNSYQRATITVSATASDNVAVSSVQFYVDGILKATDTTSPYSFSLDTTTLSTGSHTIKATAIDTSNNQASYSIVINVDNVAPTITVPAAMTVSTTTTSAVVTYTVTATDNVGVTSLVCSPASGSTFALGTTTVSCTAKDAAGNTATASFTVTVQDPDTTPPTIVISSPANGARVSGATLISASASDASGIAKIQIYIDSNLVSTVSSNAANYMWTPQGKGYHTITAVAFDVPGNSASTSVTVRSLH